MRTSSHSSSRGWSGERELEWHPESQLELGDPAPPPPPQGFRARLRAWLQHGVARLKHLPALAPSPGTVGMALVFLGLAWFTLFLGGCFLMRWLERPSHALWIMGMLTLGIPFLLAPRPTREPLGWGIVLHWIALMAFGMAAPYTLQAVQAQGAWLEDALATATGSTAWGVPGRAAWVVSAWSLEQIPESFLEEWYGPQPASRSAPTRPQNGNATRQEPKLQSPTSLHPTLEERDQGSTLLPGRSSPFAAEPGGTGDGESTISTPSQGTPNPVGADR